MTTIHMSNCPICNGSDISKHCECKDNFATRECFTIDICSKCSFAFTQNFPKENEIGKYYNAPDYISHSDTQKGLINGLYHIARKIALRSKAKLVNKVSSGKTGLLLDIGCGTGYFLNHMKIHKWIVTGIEKDGDARKYAKSKFELNVQDSDYLFKIPPSTKKVVTMWHVLEHIEQLDKTIDQIAKILQTEGLAIIALPNKDSYDAHHYHQHWAAYDVPRHLWHFSPSNFKDLIEKHGFRLLKMKPMYFDIFYISMLSEKNKGTTLAPFVGLIKGSFFFIKSIFNTQKCSSITYVIRKK